MASSQYYTIEPAERAMVIALRLAMDLDISAFNEITASLIDQWPVAPGRHVVIDLADSRYMGSVLLGLIINIRQRTRAGGGDVVVCGASPRLLQVFRSANLDRLIGLAATREQALSTW
jgi:anti-anti-sigma factor